MKFDVEKLKDRDIAAGFQATIEWASLLTAHFDIDSLNNQPKEQFVDIVE